MDRMGDEEIVKAISRNCGIAVMFSIIGRREKALLFTDHALRLIAANYAACKRWMEKRNEHDILRRSGVSRFPVNDPIVPPRKKL
ncbi:MAG TPA: hypothetical protein VF290_22225 [Pyrinomonadaceae bacterium]